jgi:hypothetical protein
MLLLLIQAQEWRLDDGADSAEWPQLLARCPRLICNDGTLLQRADCAVNLRVDKSAASDQAHAFMLQMICDAQPPYSI